MDSQPSTPVTQGQARDGLPLESNLLPRVNAHDTALTWRVAGEHDFVVHLLADGSAQARVKQMRERNAKHRRKRLRVRGTVFAICVTTLLAFGGWLLLAPPGLPGIEGPAVPVLVAVLLGLLVLVGAMIAPESPVPDVEDRDALVWVKNETPFGPDYLDRLRKLQDAVEGAADRIDDETRGRLLALDKKTRQRAVAILIEDALAAQDQEHAERRRMERKREQQEADAREVVAREVVASAPRATPVTEGRAQWSEGKV